MGRTVKGKNYVADDEVYDKKKKKKVMKSMKTAGVARALKKSQKDMGYSDILKVKPQRK